MGNSPFANPAWDLIDNAVDFAAYAIRKNLSQASIDGRIDQLARYLGALK